MNKLLLKLMLLPSGLWRGMGADMGQLKAILNVRLKLDDRKPMSLGRQQQGKKLNYMSVLTVVVSLFIGTFYILPLLGFTHAPLLGITLYYTTFLFMLTFMLITDFGNVLIDTRDKFIILPRPVNDRTIFLSRMIHIFIYLFRIVLPMSLAGWITLGLLYGWKAAVWYPVPLLLMVFLALFFVLGCYMLLLRLTSAHQFKEIISYFQIAFSIIIFAAVYILPRVFDAEQLLNLKIEEYPWLAYVPSYWLSATWSWLLPFKGIAGTPYIAIVAILVPVLLLWVTVKFFAPNFSKSIAGLDVSDAPSVPIATAKARAGASSKKLYMRLMHRLNWSDGAKAGFLITWLQTGRSRTFKMRVYPSFASVPVYFVFGFMTSGKPLAETWEKLPGTEAYLMFLYMPSFVILQAINYITMSDHYKAAWIYYASPVEKPGHVMIGAFKAMWAKFFMPFYLVITTFVLYVWGFSVMLDVVLALVNVTFFSVAMMRVASREFPFSKMEQMKQQGGKSVLRVFFTLFLIGVLGVGHWAASFFWWLKLLFLALSLIMLWLAWDSYRGTSWQVMREHED